MSGTTSEQTVPSVNAMPRFEKSISTTDAAELYLDLMKRALLNWFHVTTETTVVRPSSLPKKALQAAARKAGHDIVRRPKDVSVETLEANRLEGRDWPGTATTMIGLARLNNLQQCAERVLRDGVPGDFIETGVWRGGACIFMRAILKAHGVTDRSIWVADSFAGVPAPNPEKYPADVPTEFYSQFFTADALAVSMEQVQENFRRYGLLDEQVRFLKGWFSETLASAPIESLAVARLDGDLYESTMDALVALYPKLSPGGFLIIDDYCLPNCVKAVQDYRSRHGITDEIIPIDWSAIYWRKT
jgi:O-methyltransferase